MNESFYRPYVERDNNVIKFWVWFYNLKDGSRYMVESSINGSTHLEDDFGKTLIKIDSFTELPKSDYELELLINKLLKLSFYK